MARIRTIKPEFWSSEQVVECKLATRLFFIGLWNYCDDEGRSLIALGKFKLRIFPGDDFSKDDIRGMLDELAANGLITLYQHEDREYLQVTGWHHQKIGHPTPSSLPAPNSRNAHEDSGALTSIHEDSGKLMSIHPHAPAPAPAEGSREGGRERNDRPTESPSYNTHSRAPARARADADRPSASLAPLADGSLARGRRAIPPPPALYERQPGEKERVGPALKALADELRGSGAQERLRILETLPSGDLAKTRIIREMIEEIKNKNEVT